MAVSVLDIFKIGIGPSSSHTVGPMIAAKNFAQGVLSRSKVAPTRVVVELHGSLGATGWGHGSDKAVILGLMGYAPETIDTSSIPSILERVRDTKALALGYGTPTPFDLARDLRFLRDKTLHRHPNGMRFQAMWGPHDAPYERTYYSVGGGFVVDEANTRVRGDPATNQDPTPLLFPFRTATELLNLCRRQTTDIAGLMWSNELSWRPRDTTLAKLGEIWFAMQSCMDQGCLTEGVLPGGLKVARRAPMVNGSRRYCSHGWDTGAGRKRGRDWHGASLGTHLRSGWWARPYPLH